MAQAPQTFKNHARFFPLFHFFVAPVLMINFFVAASLRRERLALAFRLLWSHLTGKSVTPVNVNHNAKI